MNWHSRRNLIRCLVVMFTIISVLGVLTNSNRVLMTHKIRTVVEGVKQGDIVTAGSRKLSWEDVVVLAETDKSVHIEERVLADRGNLYKLAVGEFVRRPLLTTQYIIGAFIRDGDCRNLVIFDDGDLFVDEESAKSFGVRAGKMLVSLFFNVYSACKCK